MCEADNGRNEGNAVGVRRSSLLRQMGMVLCWSAIGVSGCLALAATAAATGVAPDPSPGFDVTPDPYPSISAARAPAASPPPVTRIVTVTTPTAVTRPPTASRPTATVRPRTHRFATRHRSGRVHRTHPAARHVAGPVPLPTLAIRRFGRLASPSPSAAVETISVEVALALAAFVLFSGAFVATATREVLR